jgi:riboflavin synthase
VQGHVDGCATVDRLLPQGEWMTMWFRVPANLARQMVSKGSVAVDGVSLTLVDVETEEFSVALIPHTLANTTLGTRHVQDLVNIETDILAKYVEKLLAPDRSPPA